MGILAQERIIAIASVFCMGDSLFVPAFSVLECVSKRYIYSSSLAILVLQRTILGTTYSLSINENSRANRGGAKIQLSSSILISLIVYVMPYMGVARVMIPIFWIGYAMKMYYEQYIRYHRPIGLIALIVFAGLYYFWNGEIMHYSASASVTLYHVVLGKHGYTLLNFLMLAYRICLGIAGAVAVISLMHEVKNVNKFITYVGSSTAGIYILQATILEIILYRIFLNYVNLSGISKLSIYFIMFVIAIGLVALLTWLYRFLSRNSVVDLILFGCGRLTKKIIKQE